MKTSARTLMAVLLLSAIAMVWQPVNAAREASAIVAKPVLDNPKVNGPLQTAVLAGGCFWGVQGVFEHVKGVRRVVSGYAGGERATASYDTVSTGQTGHAESVQITFNPEEVSYGELLQIFFSVVHDPTLLNRQGPDEGTQYRSAIFYMDNMQKRVAESYVQQLNQAHAYTNAIVTKVAPFKGFYAAEDYHQDFLINNPDNPYIVINDLRKIEHLKQMFPTSYMEIPVRAN